MVPFAAMLLNDQYLIDSFEVDATIVEHLVLYMYKWKFSKCRSFVENEKYLREILLLLEPTSEWRLLIECELEFALMLSTPEHPLEYPLVDTSSVSETISIMEIEEIINTLSGDFLIGLDLHRLHKIITKMQQLSSDNEKT